MVQRTTHVSLAPPAGTLAARVAGALARWLRALPPVAAADPPPRDTAGDPLALLRPLFSDFIASPESQAPLDELLHRVLRLAGAEAGALYALRDDGERADPLAVTDATERDHADAWVAARADTLRDTGRATVEVVGGTPVRLLVRLRDGAALHGCMLLRLPSGAAAGERTLARLGALAAALAGIVHGVRRARRTRRLALHEERATIARELHDSLAQSLSYLKIQVSRMQALLARHGEPGSPGHAELDAVTQELRGNLNLAYRQLRELITTCRLTMNGRTLTQALEDSANEYARRSALVVELDNRLGDTALDAHAELHVLQIVREALTNVVRHAHARRVQVRLREQSDGRVRLSVEDDGIGIVEEAERDGATHHGLLIMQERAHELGGELRVEPRAGGGTRVLVRFDPVQRTNRA